MKKAIIIIVAVVLVAAAIAGVCVWSFNSKYISSKEALNIAVADAGFTLADVADTDVDFEKQNGSATYQVEFDVGSDEYNYILNAENGIINNADSRVHHRQRN